MHVSFHRARLKVGTLAARLRLEVFLYTVFSHLWMKAANNEPLIILMSKFLFSNQVYVLKIMEKMLYMIHYRLLFCQ